MYFKTKNHQLQLKWKKYLHRCDQFYFCEKL